jgi:hypothetical protein
MSWRFVEAFSNPRPVLDAGRIRTVDIRADAANVREDRGIRWTAP